MLNALSRSPLRRVARGAAAEAACLNCGTAILAPARFCSHCGQRTDTARLSFADVVRDLMHSFVNVERGPLAFAWALLTRPGEVAREYIEGKRRRHYGPFATLVVLVGATALAVNLTGFQVLAQDGLPTWTSRALQGHFNLLLLAQLPLLGALCALAFRSARLTFPEHMVLVAYTLSVRAVSLVLVVAVAYLTSNANASPAAAYAFWAAWYVYFGWAASQFYPGVDWGLRIYTAACNTGLTLSKHPTGSVRTEKLTLSPRHRRQPFPTRHPRHQLAHVRRRRHGARHVRDSGLCRDADPG